MISLLALLFSIIIWGVVFYVLWWALGKVSLPEPFSKIAVVVLVIATVWVLIGLLTGSIAPFPVLTSLK